MSSPTDENNEVPTAAELGDNTHSESDAHIEALEPPFLVGRMEEIGKGGESIVYKVTVDSEQDNVTVFARKLLRAWPGFTRDEIESEGRAIIQLYSHGLSDNLIQVLSQGWIDEQAGVYRIDMELCACNLEQYIVRQALGITFEIRQTARSGGFAEIGAQDGPWRDWDILEQISKAVEFIHSCGLVHRDLKPLLYSPAQKLWKVADFGMTSNGSSGREVTTERVRGTSGYRAPELIRTSHYTNKVDIFAMGCIFFELFSNGRKAFKDDWESVLNNIESHFKADPQLLTVFTSAGRKLLDRMLNNNSQQRPTAKKLCSEFASYRWISLAYECGRRGKNELVIEGFRMAIQLSAVENTIWKELGDAYRAESAFNDASAAYTTAISCRYSDRALMSTLVLAARERSFDSTENLLGRDIERQSQLQALAAFLMENEYGNAAMLAVGSGNRIWYFDLVHDLLNSWC